mgnify:CR=1 FL=1
MMIAKVSKKYLITIPKGVREALDLKEGDYVAFIVRDDEVVMKKVKIEL